VTSSGGLSILDLSDPAAPKPFSHFRTDGYTRSVTFDGTRAYLPNGNGVVILDVSNPSAPQEIGFFPISVWSLAVKNGIAYIVGGNSLLTIADLSLPDAVKTLSVMEFDADVFSGSSTFSVG
jgi:hypothetical protein